MAVPLPGIRLQDVTPQPAPTLRTGVPLFLGEGVPAGEPVAVRSSAEFASHFAEAGYLGDAVRGFFENGGERCYVTGLQGRPGTSLQRLRAALMAVEGLEEADLLCAPDVVGGGRGVGEVSALQQALLDHCRRTGERFAILDPVYSHEDEAPLLAQRARLHGRDGALYHSWLRVHRLQAGRATLYEVPPCGHVAGVYARVDRGQGVHAPPANAGLEGVVDISFPAAEAILGKLHEAGINLLRPLPARGICLWGATTLGEEADWRAINVRRLFLALRRHLRLFMEGLLFENNDERLWIRISRELTAEMESLYRQGALRGPSPEAAFYVKCNADTNPREMIHAGMVVAEIGLAPAVPNQFIVVRIVHSERAVAVTAQT